MWKRQWAVVHDLRPFLYRIERHRWTRAGARLTAARLGLHVMTRACAEAANDRLADREGATVDTSPGRYCGMPGLVWYSRVTKTRGDHLRIGHALDSLDHRGARTIRGIRVAEPRSGFREVHFGGGWTVYPDGSTDSETVRDDVMYDVVDLDSICDPMGDPA